MEYIFDNDRPIYMQLIEQIKIQIISGKLKEGEKIPSVRDFALKAKVNPNTMQKALLELEDLKLVYTERTNGKYVTKDQKLIDKLRLEYASELSKKYLSSMKDIGFSELEVIKHLTKIKGEE